MRQYVSWIFVNIGSGNGILPDVTDVDAILQTTFSSAFYWMKM